MKSIDLASETILRSRTGLIVFNFVWVEAKDRATGGIVTMGLWNGDDTVTVTVLDGRTQQPVSRVYHGAGTLLEVDAIPLTTDLNIRTIGIRLSQISDATQMLIRGYDARLAPVEVHRGLFDPDTGLLIAPPVARFVGWIDGAPISTPAANGEGGIEVSCISHTRKLTFTNPAKRSDAEQSRRQGDRFRKYTDVAGEWEFAWGEETTKVGK